MDDSELLGNTEFRAALRRHVIHRCGEKEITRMAKGEALSEEQMVEGLINFFANSDLGQHLKAYHAEHGVYPEPSGKKAVAGLKAKMAFYDEEIERRLAIVEKMVGNNEEACHEMSVIRLILHKRAEKIKEWLDEPDSKDTGTGGAPWSIPT